MLTWNNLKEQYVLRISNLWPLRGRIINQSSTCRWSCLDINQRQHTHHSQYENYLKSCIFKAKFHYCLDRIVLGIYMIQQSPHAYSNRKEKFDFFHPTIKSILEKSLKEVVPGSLGHTLFLCVQPYTPPVSTLLLTTRSGGQEIQLIQMLILRSRDRPVCPVATMSS